MSKVTKQLFKEKVDAGDPEMKKVQSLLSNIYGDQSLLINEITPQNFGDFWKRLTPLFNNEVKNGTELKDKLFTLVRLKTLVSEYMWYMLTGALVTAVTYRYIVNHSCESSLQNMKKNAKMINDETNENNNDNRTYTTNE